MRLKYYYWYFKSAFSPKLCSKIVEHGLQQQDEKAKNSRKDVRESSIVWLEDEWIRDEIYPYLHKANRKAGWNFDWDDSETVQFTKYKKDQFYNWHLDQYFKPDRQGKIRKLSVTVNLLDKKEFSGGDFEFDFTHKYGQQKPEKCKEIEPRGSIVVFPSFVWHRVTPVTAGTRYSLVMWALGPPFK